MVKNKEHFAGGIT